MARKDRGRLARTVCGLGLVLLIAVMGSISAVAANQPLRVIYPQP